MQPKEVDYKQTYVDQFVPMPFEAMAMVLEGKQKQYDSVDSSQKSQLAALLKVNALSSQSPARDAKIKEYEQEIVRINESVGGDLSKADGLTSDLAMKINEDLTRGPLSNYNTNYQLGQEMLKENKAKQDIGIGKGGISKSTNERATSFAFNNFDNAVKESLKTDPNGIANFNKYNTVSEVNKADKYDAFAKDFKSSGYQKAGLKLDSSGAFYRNTDTGKEFISSAELRNAIKQYYNQDEEMQQMDRQQLELGIPKEQIDWENNNAIESVVAKYDFEKSTKNISLHNVPEGFEADGNGGIRKIPPMQDILLSQGSALTITEQDYTQAMDDLETSQSQLSNLISAQKAGKGIPTDKYEAQKLALEQKVAMLKNNMTEVTSSAMNSKDFKGEWLTGGNTLTGVETRAKEFRDLAINAYPEKFFKGESLRLFKEYTKQNHFLKDGEKTLYGKEKKTGSMMAKEMISNAEKQGRLVTPSQFLSRVNKILPSNELGWSDVRLNNYYRQLNNSVKSGLKDNPYKTITGTVYTSVDKNSPVNKLNLNLTSLIQEDSKAFTIYDESGKSLDAQTYLNENIDNIAEALGLNGDVVDKNLITTKVNIQDNGKLQITYSHPKTKKLVTKTGELNGTQPELNRQIVHVLTNTQGDGPEHASARANGRRLLTTLDYFGSPEKELTAMKTLNFSSDEPIGIKKYAKIQGDKHAILIIEATNDVNGEVKYRLLDEKKHPVVAEDGTIPETFSTHDLINSYIK